jgi:hypothetical protein
VSRWHEENNTREAGSSDAVIVFARAAAPTSLPVTRNTKDHVPRGDRQAIADSEGRPNLFFAPAPTVSAGTTVGIGHVGITPAP